MFNNRKSLFYQNFKRKNRPKEPIATNGSILDGQPKPNKLLPIMFPIKLPTRNTIMTDHQGFTKNDRINGNNSNMNVKAFIPGGNALK